MRQDQVQRDAPQGQSDKRGPRNGSRRRRVVVVPPVAEYVEDEEEAEQRRGGRPRADGALRVNNPPPDRRSGHLLAVHAAPAEQGVPGVTGRW